jgi:hypothetical protein
LICNNELVAALRTSNDAAEIHRLISEAEEKLANGSAGEAAESK